MAEYIERGETFDLVYVDHDHRIGALLEQINAIGRLSHDTTIHVFDDAVPPNIEMASDEPRGGSWVGSVWMLPLLRLFEHQDVCLCIDSTPTGMFVAFGRPELDLGEARRAADLLRKRITNIDDMKAELRFADTESIRQFISIARQSAIEHHNLTVRPASEADYQPLELQELVATKDTVRPLPVFCQDLSGDTVAHQFDSPQHVCAERQSLVQFHGATLVGTNSIYSNSVLYYRYTTTGASDTERIANAKGYGNEGTGVFCTDDVYYLPKVKVTSAQQLKGRYLLATPDERDNWGMWLLVALPSLLFYCQHRQNYDGVICFNQKRWQRGLIRFLGVEDSEVVSHDIERSYTVDSLDILCRRGRNLWVSDFDRSCFNEVIRRSASANVATELKEEKLKRLFISRVSAGPSGSRPLIEEAELIRRLEEIGFLAIEPEQFPFHEQIRMFHAADVIVGLGGAGMFNAIFAKPGTVIITIESSSIWVHAHANLFSSCELPYGVVFGREDPTDTRPIHGRWSIDVESLVVNLQTYLETASEHA